MEPTNFQGIMQIIIGLIAKSVGILYAAAFATFFWGLARFIMNTGDDKKREEGKQWMIWSIVALFVMLTLWGLIGLLINTIEVTPLLLPPI